VRRLTAGVTRFYEQLLQRISFNRQANNPALEAGVLRLKLLEPLGIQDSHTADFGFSAIPRLFENPVAATGVLAQGSGLDLLQTVR
jgi:hypothetical protein